MQFELTHSVNVPAERAKLRKLRDEIAADVKFRKEYESKYTARGFLRDLPSLEAKGKQGNGKAQIRNMRAGAAMGISPAAADMRKAQIGRFGCDCGACGVGKQGVNNE